MPTVIKIPSALDKALGEEASSALVDIFNQFDSTQRNGLERAIDLRLQTLKESMGQRFDLVEQRFDLIEKRIDERMKLAVSEANQHTDQRITTLEAKIDKRFAEFDANMEKRLGELEIRIAQSQAALIKWMFTFYIGTVITLAGLIIAYLQLFLKQ